MYLLTTYISTLEIFFKYMFLERFVFGSLEFSSFASPLPLRISGESPRVFCIPAPWSHLCLERAVQKQTGNESGVGKRGDVSVCVI